MSYEELLEITPGMFLALQREELRLHKANAMNFRFLATVISSHVSAFGGGEGIDYMKEEPPVSVLNETDEFSALQTIDDSREWFKSLAEQAKQRANIGKNSQRIDEESPGASESNEADGDVD